MNYTPEEVAKLLADKPQQPHYIAAMIRKCVNQELAALAGAAPDKPVEWIAQNHRDYWTVQVMCGPGPRFYSIRKADGQMLELPHKDSPFIPNPFAPNAPAKAREDGEKLAASLRWWRQRADHMGDEAAEMVRTLLNDIEPEIRAAALATFAEGGE